MRVLVTGGAGYIGSHVVLALLEAGHRVSLLDNFSNCHQGALRCLAELAGEAAAALLTVLRVDVRDTLACTRHLQALRPDAVIHLAGLKDVSESMRQPQRYFDVNVGGTVALLSSMDAVGCEKLVFSSSAAVYGEPQCLPVDESHRRRPKSPYGQSKLIAENRLCDWVAASPSRAVIALRYFNPVGCHGDTRRGLMLTPGGDALMNRIVAVGDGRAPHLEVFGNDYDTPDGTGVRDFIHVADLARAHVATLDALESSSQGFLPVNLGTGKGITVLQMAKTFQRHTGRKIPVVMAPRREGDLAASWAKTTRAQVLFGWRALCGYDEMCISAWQGRNHGLAFANISTGQNLSGTEYSTAT